ncbi:MAG: hypothetical protein AVDCRST_MAG49-1544 [uncultured Thermomicrobiales bacterium]|uniref:Copper resistance protein CopC n=1 Tax=uncultured Thermomicrobiales bacterium TaxID=1645740 RepID=A0A6J4UEB6_9BACT|nr:MAG: hypothetical protein AVDCRST_MAG49-1544 [uncultured Thermomicrobiales bacterium]
MLLPRRVAPRLAALAVASLLVTLVVGALLAPRTAAHAALRASDPPANAVLPAAPRTIALRFTEPLERAASGIHLLDRTGERVAGTSVQFPGDPYLMEIALPGGLPNGTYTVAWHNLSAADGHTQEGYFTFTVGDAADVTTGVAPVAATTGGPPAWLLSGTRWLALLALAPSVAVWPVWLLVLRPTVRAAGSQRVALTRRVVRLAAWSLALALLASAVALVAQAAATVGGTTPGDGLWMTLCETRYGRWWLVRLVLLAGLGATLAGCAWSCPRRRPVRAGLALALAAAVPLPFSMVSHAAAQTSGRATAIAVDAVHLAGAAVWAGGVGVLALALLPTVRHAPPPLRRDLLAVAVPRFSAVALVAWAALGLTGLYMAWLQVGSLDALRDTGYGRSLTAKLLLVAPLLALGAANLLVVGRRVTARTADAAAIGRRWGRRFTLTVGAEAVLVVALLLVTGRLVGQEPARAALTADAPRAMRTELTLAGQRDDRPATLTLSPGAAGPNRFRLTIGGEPLPPETEAVLRLALPDLGIVGNEVALARMGGNAFEATGTEVAVAGAWQVEAVVRRIGAFDYRTAFTLPVGATPPPPSGGDQPGPAWRFDRSGVAALALALLAIIGLVAAWSAKRAAVRARIAGLGLANLAVAVALLLQARIATPPDGDPGAVSALAAPPAGVTAATLPPAATPSAGSHGMPEHHPTAATDHHHAAPAHGSAPAGTPSPPGPGTPVALGDLVVALDSVAPGPGPHDLVVAVATGTGGEIDARVTVSARPAGGDAGTVATVQGEPTSPGRYAARGLTLAPGRWQIVVRVAPTGRPSAAATFVVEVPG